MVVSTVVLVSLLVVVVPATMNIISSPITLLILSPILIIFAALALLLSHVAAGYVLDRLRPRPASPPPFTAARPLAFSTPAAWQAVLTRSQWSSRPPQSLAPLFPAFPSLSAALNDLLILLVRDFVLPWYTPLSPSPAFPTALSATLHSSLTILGARAAAVDVPALLVRRVLPLATAHIEQFRAAEVALRGARLERALTHGAELDRVLAGRYGALHSAVDNLASAYTRQSEEAHLRKLVDRALPHVLPEAEKQSAALRVVVREVVACAVLYPVMEMLSDPDFWNRAIDQVAGAAIHQQKLITKVRNVLEAQSPHATRRLSIAPERDDSASGRPARRAPETITIRTDARHFASFLRSIGRCSSLLDARRLKNDVVGEIRRTRALLADHEKEDWINGERTEDVVAFLDRLYTAKRKVEDRIAVLGGGADNSVLPDLPARTTGLTLRAVLHNPSALSYFMEFMDRRSRALPVQFWLTVESFKNPLEEAADSDSDSEERQLQTQPTAAEDVRVVHELYFANDTPHPSLNAVSRRHIDAIRDPNASAHAARRAVMRAQREVEKDMEADFEAFERSELWHRVVGDVMPQSLSASVPAPSGPRSGPVMLMRTESTPLLAPPARPHSVRSGESSNSITPPSAVRSTSSTSVNALGGNGTSPTRTPATNLEELMGGDAEDAARAPLFDGSEDNAQLQRMAAIQAALTDIIAGDAPPENDLTSRSSRERDARAAREARGVPGDRSKRRVMFDDEEPDEEPDEDEEDETLDDDASINTSQGSFQLAAPGDLQLSYEIQRLSDKITDLQAQDAMLDRLLQKAELTGDAQELRLLRKSRNAMVRELRELRFQRAQYEQQESANRLLSDRTRVKMASTTVGEEEGRQVVRYLVEVQQLAPDGSFASGWVVARRYNEFLGMHNKLRERYALVRNLDFPGKRLVTALSGSFVDSRRVALEKYMQSIIAIPVVCESDELRAFLSRESPFIASESVVPATSKPPPSNPSFIGQGLVRTVYRSVAGSIDDMFFGPSMLDVMLQRLTRQAAEFAGIVGAGMTDEDLVTQALRASGRVLSESTFMQLTGDIKPMDGETSSSTFSAPICDLILAVFELNKKNNWLRRQAIVIILQQVLGGTIERKIRENVKASLDEPHLLSFVKIFRDGLWPEEHLKKGRTERTAEDKIRTRDDANRKLSAVMPDLAANMIGRSNARRGARRIFAVLQNQRLNQHIAYTILDEVMDVLFPDASKAASGPKV